MTSEDTHDWSILMSCLDPSEQAHFLTSSNDRNRSGALIASVRTLTPDRRAALHGHVAMRATAREELVIEAPRIGPVLRLWLYTYH